MGEDQKGGLKLHRDRDTHDRAEHRSAFLHQQRMGFESSCRHQDQEDTYKNPCQHNTSPLTRHGIPRFSIVLRGRHAGPAPHARSPWLCRRLLTPSCAAPFKTFWYVPSLPAHTPIGDSVIRQDLLSNPGLWLDGAFGAGCLSNP